MSTGTLVYALFLVISGIAMIVMAALRFGRPARRVISGLFGAGYAIYGLYLLLFFRGGQVIIFFYAFIVPILLIAQLVRGRGAAQSGYLTPRGRPSRYGRSAASGSGQPPWGYGQPTGYGQPPAGGYGQPPAGGGYGRPPAGGATPPPPPR